MSGTIDHTTKGNAAALSAAPYAAMLKSTAYGRLRAEHPAEFAPSSVFFTHDDDRSGGSAIDRRNSFRVKAALVYEAVTGKLVDDHMLRANSLLLALASKCHSKISGQAEGNRRIVRRPDCNHSSPYTIESDTTCLLISFSDAVADAEAGDATDVTDEHWDAKKQLVVDGIFLVVGFLPKLNEAITTKNADRDSVDQIFKSRHMLDMVTDVIKLENQLWLQDLLNVARHIEAVVKETVGHSDFKDVKESMGVGREYKLDVTEQNLADVIHRFCWYYSPFSTKKPAAAPKDSPFKDVVASGKEAAARTLLDCLHMSVVKPALGKSGSVTGRPSRMPTARDLRRSGVRLQASENGRAEIEFTQPAVSMPALVYDFKLATVARNLLAREYEEQSKPITRYFQMVNEIVEDAADVRILRRAGVVRGGSGGAQEVHELIKNIDGHATYPSVYVAMDREIDKVREYHDQRMANFFVRNRPGVIWASSVAAISVAAIVATRRKRG
jgi:hypothetical protein